MLITKAVEYLIAVGFLFVFIMFWRMIINSKPIFRQGHATVDTTEQYHDKYLSNGHAWLRKKSSADVLVGIDGFLQKLTGTLNEIKVPVTGSEIKVGDPLFRLFMGSRAVQVNAPVAGKVAAVNWKLIGAKPYAITLPDDPVWLVKLQSNDAIIEDDTLLANDQAVRWLRDETNRLMDFLSDQSQQPELAGITLADGGIPVHGALQLLSAEGLEMFEKEFLNKS